MALNLIIKLGRHKQPTQFTAKSDETRSACTERKKFRTNAKPVARAILGFTEGSLKTGQNSESVLTPVAGVAEVADTAELVLRAYTDPIGIAVRRLANRSTD